MTQLRKAILFSVLNQYSLQLINFISIAILARLLTPEEVGVFAVATSIAFLAIEIRSFGVSEFLVREKEISPRKVAAVVGVMVIMSWGLAFILIGSSAWIADFYGVPDLRNILWIITLPFFFAPYSSVPFALLAREMKFDVIMKIDVLGGVVRNVVSIGLVMADFGYYGLAYGAFAGVVAEFLAILYYRPHTMVWRPSFVGLGHIFRVGMQISFSKFLNTTSQNASDLVLGRLATMKDVGLYSRGLGLIMFLHNSLVQAVGPVALPHLSQVHRSGGSVKDAYLNAIVLMGAFSLPLFAVVSLCAFSMITALFGDQWEYSARIAAILAFWEMLRSIHCFSVPALLATGHERLALWYETLSFVFKIVVLIAMVPRGLEMVAWGFVISGAVDFILATQIMRISVGLSVFSLLRAFVPNLLVAALCWGTLKTMTHYLNFEAMNPWLALLIIGSAMVPVWLIGLKLTRNRAWPLVARTIETLVSKVFRAQTSI